LCIAKLKATKKFIALKPLQVNKDLRRQELRLKVGLARVVLVETLVISWNWIQVEEILKVSIGVDWVEKFLKAHTSKVR
jgi:hypothetical protein